MLTKHAKHAKHFKHKVLRKGSPYPLTSDRFWSITSSPAYSTGYYAWRGMFLSAPRTSKIGGMNIPRCECGVEVNDISVPDASRHD